MPRRAKTAIIQLKLRIPETLRARLAAAAKRNGASLNSELKKRLEASLAAEGIVELVKQQLMAEQFEARDKAHTPLPSRVQKEQK